SSSEGPPRAAEPSGRRFAGWGSLASGPAPDAGGRSGVPGSYSGSDAVSRATISAAPPAEVAEWQTRRSQTPLRATSSGFKSRLRHHRWQLIGSLTSAYTGGQARRPPARTGGRQGRASCYRG